MPPFVGIIASLLLIVIALAIGAPAQPVVPLCVTDEDRVNIRRALLQAVDDALKDHIKALFLGWIKDPARQPERASAGLQGAIVAYQRARADALRWNPKSC
jgi:hypothetical protein